MKAAIGLCAVLTVLTGRAPLTFAEVAPVDSNIRAVTIYADRALVRRSADIKISPATQQYTIKNLPGWLDSGSIRAWVEPAGQAEILDVEVKKEYLAKADNADVQEARREVEEISDQVQVLEDEVILLQARLDHVEKVKGFSTEKLPRDALTRDIPIQHYKEIVEFASGERTTIIKRQREIEKEKRELVPEKQARERRLAELQQKARLEFYSIILTVKGSKAVAGTLSVDYLLPGATWEPVHELRTVDGMDQLGMVSYARIIQTTGEDWSNAAISLSTQSPTQPVNIPELEALLVGVENAARVFGGQAANTFDTANTLYLANNPVIAANQSPAQQVEFTKNVQKQMGVQERVKARFKKLQDRGTTVFYRAQGDHTVRTDGRPVRVPIGRLDLEAKERIIAAPEITLNAARTVDVTNTGDQPLLPGEVSLFKEGAFLGLTEVDFVGSGEEFALFVGVADDIKLSRKLDHKASWLKRGKKTNRMKVAFDVDVQNLSDHGLTVRLADRIPVSEDRAIQIEGIRIDPEVKPDKDGLLVWELNLAGKGRQAIRIEYTLEYPVLPPVDESVNFDMPSSLPSPAYEQIMDLEARF